MIKFGVSIPTGREALIFPTGFASKETIIGAARHAEELGYYSVWANDHITTPNYVMHVSPKPSYYEPLISLAAICTVTEKVKLATGVFVLPWRTPALVICAKQIATLDALSDGRVILAVGKGAYQEESDALYVMDRIRRLDEGLRGLRELFEKSKSSFNGKYVQFKDVELLPKPIQHPLPIYIGQHSVTPGVLNRIGTFAQGWVPDLTPDQFLDAKPKLEEMLHAHGRDHSKIELVREISVSLDNDRRTAISRYKRTPSYAHNVSLAENWGKRAVEFEADIVNSLIGTADDIINVVQRYVDAGVQHFMLNFAVTEPSEFKPAMESFADEVMESFA
jgi:probable F420-dependent oxidoreductase